MTTNIDYCLNAKRWPKARWSIASGICRRASQAECVLHGARATMENQRGMATPSSRTFSVVEIVIMGARRPDSSYYATISPAPRRCLALPVPSRAVSPPSDAGGFSSPVYDSHGYFIHRFRCRTVSSIRMTNNIPVTPKRIRRQRRIKCSGPPARRSCNGDFLYPRQRKNFRAASSSQRLISARRHAERRTSRSPRDTQPFIWPHGHRWKR